MADLVQQTTMIARAAGLLPARAAMAIEKFGSAFAALSVRLLAAALAYVLQIALARTLGTDEYGIFAYAWAWVTIGGFIGTFGFGQIAVRFLANYSESGDSAHALGFIRVSLQTLGAGTILIAISGLAIIHANPELLGHLYFAPIVLALATFPLFALGDMAEGYARSQGWSMLALAPPYILRQLLLLAIIPLVYWFGITPDATIAMGAALFATAITSLVQIAIVLRRLLAGLPAKTIEKRMTRAWLAAAWPVLLADAAQVLRQNADVLILAFFAEPAQIALYFAATRVASLLGLVEFAVGAAAAHRFARVPEGSNSIILRRLANEAAMLTFWPTLAAAIAISVTAPMILSVFGSEYVASAPLVGVLAIGYVVRAIIGPAEEFLMMRGHGRSTLLAQFLGLEVTIGLCWALAPEYGAVGVAFGNLGALCVTTLVLAVCCGRQTGIVPLPLPLNSRATTE